MKQKSPKPQDISALEELFNKNFGKIKHELQVQDQKRKTEQADLRLRITEVRHDLEEEFRVEIRTSAEDTKSELENRIARAEENIHKRIQNLGNLITESFQKKVDNHEKRLKKLERLSAT